MNKTTGIIVAIIVVLGVGAGAFALTKKTHQNNSNSPSNAPGNTTGSSTTSETPPPTVSTEQTNQTTSNTINYTNSGFSPASLTVKAGSIVTIKNDSSRVLQFDSDPHPQHTDDPELNVGSISPGQSKTVTVTTIGSHGYHNHLNEDDKGVLIVE